MKEKDMKKTTTNSWLPVKMTGCFLTALFSFGSTFLCRKRISTYVLKGLF